MIAAVPFVVGQWVRGDRFYGREPQIEEILQGHRNCIWLVGSRRIGKTSLLKQIEHITATENNQHYFPIFWDLQGAEAPEELHLNFADALLDADERLEQIGIRLEDVEADDLFVSLGRLRRKLRSRNLKLLLLCDEAEELIKLQQKDPSLLRKLGRAMQSHDHNRSVLASTIRLWALAEHIEDTSSFLHAFTPPLYVERLSDDEARSLIEQSHLEPEERPDIAEEAIEIIRNRCDHHPYLLQLVCKRFLETGALDEAIEQVATDRMVSYFFSVDFEMLSVAERTIIKVIARQSAATSDSIREECALGSDALVDTLSRLENLGFIRRNAEQRFEVPNYFFHRWLQGLQEHGVPKITRTAPASTTAQREPKLNRDDQRPAEGLIATMRRRSVFRVGIAYLVVAWILLQIGDVVLDILEVPAWAGKLLIVFLTLGLPVALIVAWAFELTPEGVKRQKDLDPSMTASRRAGRKLDIVIVAVLAIAVLFFLFNKFV